MSIPETPNYTQRPLSSSSRNRVTHTGQRPDAYPSVPSPPVVRTRYSGSNNKSSQPSALTKFWNRVTSWFRSFFNRFKPKRKLSEVPDILPQKPKGLWAKLKNWFKSAVKWLSPSYAFQRFFSFLRKRQADAVLKQLRQLTPERMKAILDQPALKKIDFSRQVRKTTGVARASRFFGPENEIMRHYRNFTFINILESYGIQWSPFKVARDALQNFYDGQGQTLDGVSIQVSESRSGSHRVNITASATYDVDKLLALGGTDKQGKDSTAGGFGEGAKVMALLLLRDFGAKQVTFRSGEWQADFKLDYPGSQFVSNNKVRGLMVQLTPLNPPIKGNSLEFETTDPILAETLKDGHKLFYNPSNEIFKDPLYENEIGGFKLQTSKEAPGRVYEAGQLRAFGQEGHYNAIPGLILWSNKKVLNLTDRDRVAIQDHDVETILRKVVEGMSLEQTAQGIQVLRDHWFYKKPEDLLEDKAIRGDDKKAANMMLETLCSHYAALTYEAAKGTTKKGESPNPAFIPEGLVAINPYQLMRGKEGQEQLTKLFKDGYIPVNPALQHLGVPDGYAILMDRNALLESKATKITHLTPREQRQLKVLSSGLNSLIETVKRQNKDKHSYFTSRVDRLAELSTLPIDVVSLPENKNGELASDSFVRVSQNNNRILIDRSVLSKKSFPEAIGSLFKMVQSKEYWVEDAIYPWFFGNLPHWQQLKEDWDREKGNESA